MSESSEIRELQPGLTAFPQGADIFVADQPWLAEHLLPLLSIDLGVLKPELAGTVVHMLAPLEPADGCLGEGSERFHNAYTTLNWFALQLTEDNRYRFLGQEGFFQRAALHEAPVFPFLAEASVLRDFEEKKASHAKAKAHFQQHGELTQDYGDGLEPVAFLDTLGGAMSYGNWSSGARLPSAFRFTDHARDPGVDRASLPDDGLEISLNGKPLFQVATAAAEHWTLSSETLLLFYEPESRTALLTLDWT